ncbi:hemerythrin domain-containing protein [Gordonia sp. JH63]|uniref:hemerythrin domain-containing protein n=1 Tax=Gordonia sp. p3-SID1431 TaxID=2916159 RepID=UPI00131FD40E|nr:hemerythrin domain-containing protein [Gordonia sp. p3-SID1431]MCT1352084.1 hemerythrin domain-containing protein [Gordonia sp. p3-SID1431]QHD88326.1 hemerythrin domain-containing protein [Gordonia sp. JH63]
MTSRPSARTDATAPTTPDLTGMKLAHRGMLDDTRRFADILGRIGGGELCDGRRRKAIGDYLDQLCASIHHHHTIEDEVVWPILTASAGAAVDVHDLKDDHTQLDALLAALQARTAAFTSAQADHRVAANELAATLGDVHQLLGEHIADEERVVFPIVDRYVSVADWDRVEKAARSGASMRFEAPRMMRHADERELAKMKREAGPVIRAVLTLLVRSFDKREAIIAGPVR